MVYKGKYHLQMDDDLGVPLFAETTIWEKVKILCQPYVVLHFDCNSVVSCVSAKFPGNCSVKNRLCLVPTRCGDQLRAIRLRFCDNLSNETATQIQGILY